jgi:death-on-curing protein
VSPNESLLPEQAEEVAELLVRVYEIHEVVIGETGGLPGLREASLLHAAAARPFATFSGVELYPSDFEKAAALFHSLIKSHPFMDGTKRTAFGAALYMLERLGHRIPDQLPKDEVIRFCVEVAEEAMRQAEGLDPGGRELLLMGTGFFPSASLRTGSAPLLRMTFQ